MFKQGLGRAGFTGNSGIILTLDAMVALVLAVVLATAILSLGQPVESGRDKALYLRACDILAVADKAGYIQEAMDGDPTDLDVFFEDVRSNTCLSLEVLDSEDETEFGRDTGCEEIGYHIQCQRSVIHEGENYIGRLRIWHM